MRCYNGCPDDELQAVWDNNDKARKYIVGAGYLVTWFPVEGKYRLCEKETYKAIGEDPMFNTLPAAAEWLRNYLTKEKLHGQA